MVAVTVSDGFEAGTWTLLALGPAVLLGLLVPRPAILLLPVLMIPVLGELAFQVACPCYEDGRAFFYFIAGFYFALPSMALILVAFAIKTRGKQRLDG